MLSATDLGQLADVAIAAATEAGRMIASSRPREVKHKEAGESLASQVVTEIDRHSERIIIDALQPTFDSFDLGLLTEEQVDDGGRLSSDHFWCIDPLDGTLPYVEGSSGYAVSIALVGRDGRPQIGVVYDPVEKTLIHALAGVGAFRNTRPWVIEPARSDDVLSVFADRSFVQRPDHAQVHAGLKEIALGMGLTGVQVHTGGGAVMNACRALDDRPACYFKFPGPSGGGSLWDFAATACVFAEAGAVASDIHGDPLDLNRAESTFMNHRGVLFATDESLARHVRALYAAEATRSHPDA